MTLCHLSGTILEGKWTLWLGLREHSYIECNYICISIIYNVLNNSLKSIKSSIKVSHYLLAKFLRKKVDKVEVQMEFLAGFLNF